MLEFTVEDLSAEEIERLRAIYEPLAVSVRELVDATIRTEVDADTVAAVKADIDAATARLRSNQIDGAFGGQAHHVRTEHELGQCVIGLRNPIAPPLDIHRDPDGRYWCDFDLGAAYEGPPGHVHGGVSALVLDHVLGGGGQPGRQATLHRQHHRAVSAGLPAWGGAACRSSDHPGRRREKNLCLRLYLRRRGHHGGS